MNGRWQRRTIATLGFSLAVALGTLASAQRDDHATAEAVLKEVEASPKKAVAAEMIARAKTALDRGARLRSAGDEAHARLADSAARTWAEAARDVERSAEVEERADRARRGATDAGTQAERERALLEEAITQAGRLRAQLEELERERKEHPARTSTSAADGGAPRAPAPKAAPPKAARDGGAN